MLKYIFLIFLFEFVCAASGLLRSSGRSHATLPVLQLTKNPADIDAEVLKLYRAVISAIPYSCFVLCSPKNQDIIIISRSSLYVIAGDDNNPFRSK